MIHAPKSSEARTSEPYHVVHHIAPISLYLKIFAALVVFTALTVGVYQVHLGSLNLVVAIVIATVKAALVLWFFMHIQHEAKFNTLVFLSSILFGAIFLAYTLNDTGNRGQLDEFNGSQTDPARGGRAYGSYAD